MSELPLRHAAVIGINKYGHGIAELRSAVPDARAVSVALKEDHGYLDPIVLLDAEATLAGIVDLLDHRLPARVAPDSGLVLYFAGHGIAFTDNEIPQGYLIPQDARCSEPETWLSMDKVRKALDRLRCRHLLVVLDCCYAGSFRWTASRKIVVPSLRLSHSQYARFLQGQAWQVLTSASHDQLASDLLCNTRDREGEEEHSPFAAALLAGLAGKADWSSVEHKADGVITATELYLYIREVLHPRVGPVSRQTPGLWPLKPENTGEFIFVNPQPGLKPRDDPPLDDDNNPWLGLQAYGPGDVPLFFGRERVVKDLLDRLLDDSRPPLLAVVGASGSGKSSVVKAGVQPRLEQPPEELSQAVGAWTLVNAPRLRGDPRTQLAAAERRLAKAPEGHRTLLFIDQFEELYTQCPNVAARDGFLKRLRELMTGPRPVRVLLTLRSDFEPQLKTSEALGDLLARGRYLVPALTSEEYREIIEQPATVSALYFEPRELVGELVDEVMAMPGALPLLSFALAEMYRQAQLRRRETGAMDRALTRQDYDTAGGVVGALHRRASELIEEARIRGSLATVRRVALRMASTEGGRVARRRISRRELDYAQIEEQERVTRIVGSLTESRLVPGAGPRHPRRGLASADDLAG